MSAIRNVARQRERMGELLKQVRINIRRSDSVCKQSWAAIGITDYRQAIQDWKSRGVKVPVDHPFYRFIREADVHEQLFYRHIRLIVYEGSERSKKELWQIFKSNPHGTR